MTGSYLLYIELHYNGLMTDWGYTNLLLMICDKPLSFFSRLRGFLVLVFSVLLIAAEGNRRDIVVPSLCEGYSVREREIPFCR